MHLQTTQCKCGYVFSKQDIKPPLLSQRQALSSAQKNFYGGNVDKFSSADCPECGLAYTLWLKQIGQTWKVTTISARGWDPDAVQEQESLTGDIFDSMTKAGLKEWLDERGVKYHTQLGDKKLREACRTALLTLQPTDEENPNEDQ